MPFNSLILSVIFISLLQTAFWFSLFILFFPFFEGNIKILCVFSLAIYLLIAQPIKDWSLGYLFGGKKTKWRLKEFDFLNELDNIDQVEDSFAILRSTSRKFKIPYLDLHIFVSNPYQVRLLSHRIFKTHKIQGFLENKELIAYIQSDPWGKNLDEYPTDLQNYLSERNTYCVIPIFFGSILLGIFSFSSKLKKPQIQIFEAVARRLSLVVHKNLLDDKIHLSKDIEKSFLIARRIEFFLESRDQIKIFDYELEKVKTSWQEKYFPVYYEVKKKVITAQDKKEKSYVILCRPNKNLHKGTIINLCLIQGYFVSLCESSTNLIKLISRLQGVTKEILDEKVFLDGFILLIEPEEVRIHYFGKQLKIKKDAEEISLKDSPPLGSSSWKLLNITRAQFDHKLTLSIRNYPLITIKKNTPIKPEQIKSNQISIFSSPFEKIKNRIIF